MPPKLTREKFLRYGRQVVLPEVTWRGQQRLLSSRVLLVGLGGLGSPVALYLAGAGVGTLGLVDGDRVSLSNLHRQVVHGTPDLDRPKVESAAERIRAINPDVQVALHRQWIRADNVVEVLSGYDVIVDGTDNFPVRYLLNDACAMLGKPLVYGGILRFEGQVTVFDTRRGGPCLRCLFPEPPAPGEVPSCVEVGVLGVVPGIIGTLQANEVIKLLLGMGDLLVGRLLLMDALAARFREVRFGADSACPVCGASPSITELVDDDRYCSRADGDEEAPPSVSAEQVRAWRSAGDSMRLLDVREPWERAAAPLPDVLAIPLSELVSRIPELAEGADTPLVVICQYGWRSQEACALLRAHGVERAVNLEGGVEAWLHGAEGGVGTTRSGSTEPSD